MRRLNAAAGLLGLLIIAGCSVAEFRGTVTELEFEQSKQVCAKKKPYKCTTVPECWEMEIVDSKDIEHEFCLDRAVWEGYKVGDMYPRKQNW